MSMYKKEDGSLGTPDKKIIELTKQLAKTQEERDRLVAAADRLVKRWDTPHWKNAPATAEYIYQLRDIVTEVKGGPNE